MVIGKIVVLKPRCTIRGLQPERKWAFVPYTALMVTHTGKIYLDLNAPVFTEEPDFEDCFKIKKNKPENTNESVLISVQDLTNNDGYFTAINDPTVLSDFTDFPKDFLELTGEIIIMESVPEITPGQKTEATEDHFTGC